MNFSVSKKRQSRFFEKVSLRSLRAKFFSDVHAAGKKDSILFRRSGGETLRGFSTGCNEF